MDNEITKLTILHSNDLHGDFMPRQIGEHEVGGLPRLSGYIKKVRAEKENVLYAIAGDLFRGSIIDSEYCGLSTIDLVNILRPDVTTVGNHEVDYGLAHLLFLEKCARFPIINANLFVTMNGARLFMPYLICDNYRTVKTDMTILLTHIGLEMDKQLAAQLDPDWGVNLIIGGHSHSYMRQPAVVNGIPIVQAGTGTRIIGQFDLQYDREKKELVDLRWHCVPINEKTAPKDEVMEELLDSYRTETDKKYKRVVCHWARKLTHPGREQETEMGNLYADAIQTDSSFDIMMVGSGSIRKKELGPVLEYQDMVENTPFDDAIWMFEVTGAQFRRIVKHLMRDDAWKGETEFYQFSRGVRILYNRTTKELLELKFHGEDVTDDMRLKLALQNYHFKNFDDFMGVPLEEVRQNMRPRVVATSFNNIMEEYFATHDNLDAHVEGRIEIID